METGYVCVYRLPSRNTYMPADEGRTVTFDFRCALLTDDPFHPKIMEGIGRGGHRMFVKDGVLDYINYNIVDFEGKNARTSEYQFIALLTRNNERFWTYLKSENEDIPNNWEVLKILPKNAKTLGAAHWWEETGILPDNFKK